MILTDTHTHLYLDQFDEDRDEMIKRAIDSGVERLFLPDIDSSTSQALLDLCTKYPNNCFAMTGLHPCSVKDNYKEELGHVKKQLDSGKYIAVGEIGIDLYWDKTTLGIQQEAFATQINWAKEMGLPIVIHTRDSFNEIFEVVDELNDDKLFGIFHCFNGTLKQAQKIIEYGGFKMGIGGVVTFKNAGVDKVVKQLDLKHLVLETDSPYLTPTPHRGKRNESAYTRIIADKLSDLFEKPIEEIAEITTDNSKAVFGV